MSFIEGQPASASVEACDPAVRAIITHVNIKKFIQADPAFAARFYEFLAVILSRHLRRH